MSNDTLDLDALEAALARASETPWSVPRAKPMPGQCVAWTGDGGCTWIAYGGGRRGMPDADALAIVAAVNAAPALLARARQADAAEAELTAARETVAKLESTVADQLKVTVVARQAVSDVVCQRNAALARVAAMEPVVDAAEAWVKVDWATARHKREELARAIDTFRSTSKPQEPTSE
jgi:hypothetical protein